MTMKSETAVETLVEQREEFEQFADGKSSLLEIAAQEADASEERGGLSDPLVAAIKESGLTRMLQAPDFGGEAVHPVRFFEASIDLAAKYGSAGWVAGVVAVHNHELAQADPLLQEEVLGADPDTWTSSSYNPVGRARVVPGGFSLSGHWQFSSGAGASQWAMLGGFVTDAEGQIIEASPRHFMVPRSDYQIITESWNVMGLKGTGSKDIVVEGAFVPDHRAIEIGAITDGTGGYRAGREDPLFSMPRNIVFSAAVTAATLGICQGVIEESAERTTTKNGRYGKASEDPYWLAALGTAAADVQASIRHFLWDIERSYELARDLRGAEFPYGVRAEVRRNQVRASHRSVDAADRVFRLSGGSGIRADLPLERMWRDAHAALHHAQQTQGPIVNAAVRNQFGLATTTGIKF
jgi:3-hydroxy-9,10-secoandrosta-1,3,5(10)-triene-9,17-dione monooxygenase